MTTKVPVRTLPILFFAGLFLFRWESSGWAQIPLPPTVSVGDHDHVLRIAGRDSADLFGVALELAEHPTGSTRFLLVGSPLGSDPFFVERSGRVDVFDSSQLAAPGLIDLVTTTLPSRAVFFGQLSGDRFGQKTKTGDFDGDGILDLAISAPYYNLWGRIYVYLGTNPAFRNGAGIWGASGEIRAASADILMDGDVGGTGLTLDAADFDRDGIDDLVIGSPYAFEGLGQVYVVHGRRNWGQSPILLAHSLTVYSATYQSQIRVYRGRREDNRIGESLAVGDLDGDGTPELIIGADNEDIVRRQGNQTSTLLKTGRVYIIGGENVFPNPPATAETILTPETSDLVLTGRAEFDRFGDTLHVTRWNDTDPVDDLWISAPYAEDVPFPEPEPGPNDERGIVSLYQGGSALFCNPTGAASALFCFSPNWRTLGFEPPNLVSVLNGEESAWSGSWETVTNEHRYPDRSRLAFVGFEKSALFGGAVSDGDILPGSSGTELAVGASLALFGAVSILSRADLASSTPGTPRDLQRSPETLRILGEFERDRFGFRILTADLFPDPGDELIVSAPNGGIADRKSGMVYILNADTLLIGDATADIGGGASD